MTGIAIVKYSYDLNHIEPLEFTVVLLAHQIRGIMVMYILVAMTFLALWISSLGEEYSSVFELGLLSLLLAVLFDIWKALRNEHFLNSLFRIGKP